MIVFFFSVVVEPEPISTTTTVPSTVTATVHTTPADFKSAEDKCWIDK